MTAANSSLSSFYKPALRTLLQLVYPEKCPVCGLISAGAPCRDCIQALESPDERSLRLGGLDGVVSAFLYAGAGGRFVRALKYRRETALVDFMSGKIREAFERVPRVDRVIPVPIHPLRRAERGFNQAELLAERLPLVEFDLVRIRATPPQARLSPAARAANLSGAMSCPADLSGQRVLLIDDVVTSGATARECARALRKSGATWVGILTFAAGIDPEEQALLEE